MHWIKLAAAFGAGAALLRLWDLIGRDAMNRLWCGGSGTTAPGGRPGPEEPNHGPAPPAASAPEKPDPAEGRTAYEKWTRRDLARLARDLGIPGRTGMDKKRLIQTLREVRPD